MCGFRKGCSLMDGFNKTCLSVALEAQNNVVLTKICEYLSQKYDKSEKDKHDVKLFFKDHSTCYHGLQWKFSKSTCAVKNVMSSEVFQLYNDMFV